MSEAFDRFLPHRDKTVLFYEDGDFAAVCVAVPSSWSWVVYHEGRAVAGGRSWNIDAYQACAAALHAIETRRAEARLGLAGPTAPDAKGGQL